MEDKRRMEGIKLIYPTGWLTTDKRQPHQCNTSVRIIVSMRVWHVRKVLHMQWSSCIDINGIGGDAYIWNPSTFQDITLTYDVTDVADSAPTGENLQEH